MDRLLLNHGFAAAAVQSQDRIGLWLDKAFRQAGIKGFGIFADKAYVVHGMACVSYKGRVITVPVRRGNSEGCGYASASRLRSTIFTRPIEMP